MTGALVIRDEKHYLTTIAEVRSLTERIERVEDAKHLADKAAAARVWAQRARLGEEQVNLAAIAKLWAERRAGELLALMRDGAGRLPNGTVPEANISRRESHEYQRLAQVPDFYAQNEGTLQQQGAIGRREGREPGERFIGFIKGAMRLGWEDAADQLDFEREEARARRAA